jgi:hypothetical protein
MTKIYGEHTFQLDAHYLANPAMNLHVKVSYEVEVSWNREDQAVEMGKMTPEAFRFIVGGTEAEEQDWRDAKGVLQLFLLRETDKLGLEQLGITDEDAKDAIEEEEEIARFDRDHAVGRI